MDVTLPLGSRDGAGGLEHVAEASRIHGARLMLRRRLARLVLVELLLEVDAVTLPDDVRRAPLDGRRVRALVDVGARARRAPDAPAGVDSVLVREAPQRLPLARLFEDGPVALGSQYLLPAVEGAVARTDAHVSLEVDVPRYAVQAHGARWDAHVPGGALLVEHLHLRLDRRPGELPVLRHAAAGARVLTVAEHSEVVDARSGLVEFRVPVGQGPAAGGLRGRLLVRVLPWP